MLRISRITRADFKRLKIVRRVHGVYFSLVIAEHPRAAAAFVVSKKAARLATVRNRIKRRCRAAFNEHRNSVLPAAYIFYAKKNAADAPYKEISADVALLLKKIA